jgi:polyphosphate kinase 2 (PPK2 family)
MGVAPEGAMRVRAGFLASLVLLFFLSTQAVAQKTGLPPVARTPVATKVRASDKRIETFRQKYLLKVRTGTLTQVSAKKAAVEKQIVEKAKALNSDLKKQKDDRPILIILEGPDGAGKSSTVARIKGAFDGTHQIAEAHFGAPPKDAEDVHWIKRYFEKLPAKGQVMIWDRSYYGRAVYDPYYGMADKKSTAQTIDQINGFEKMLSGKVRVVKIYMNASADRQAQTIGKREATAPEKLTESDYTSFKDRKVIKGYMKDAIGKTGKHIPWHEVSMDDRGAARLEILDILRSELIKK